MASAKPINLGIIGLSTAGWATAAHAPALAHPSLRSNVRVSAILTSSEKSAAATKEVWSKTWPGLRAYSGKDASDIVNDPDVDVVVITVKAPDHKEIVKKTIAAGKDFFIEFPVGINLEQGEEIRRQVQANGSIRVAVGLQGRQSAWARKLKRVLDTGKIGKILSTTSIANLPRESRGWQPELQEGREYSADKNNGVTLMTVAAGHQLDNLIYLLGPVASVSGTSSRQYKTYNVFNDADEIVKVVPTNTDDHFAASGSLVSGAFMSLTWKTGYISTPGRKQFLWIIDGENGSITIESDATTPTPGAMPSMFHPTVTVNGQPLNDYLKAEGIEYSDPQLVLEEGEEGYFVSSIRRSWLEFAKTLRGGKGEEATLDDALEVKRVVDAIERSISQDGLSVKLN